MKTLKNILLAATMSLGVFLIAGTASASVLYSQSVSTATQTTAGALEQVLGTGLSGYAESISVIAAVNTSTTVLLDLIQCNVNNRLDGSCVLAMSYTSGSLLPGSHIVTMTGGWELQSSKYYFLDYRGGTSANVKFLGSASNLWAGGACVSYPSAGSSCSPISDLYFEIGGQGLGENSAITALNTPTDGQVVSTNAVTFNFSYYNIEGFTIAGVSLVDVTASQSVLGATTSITSSGSATASMTRYLTTGHQYRWSAYLAKANGQRISSQTRTFYVVSTPSFSSSTASLVPIDQITESNASSSLAQTLLNSINIFSLAQERIPFAYIYRIVEQIDTDNLPATSEFAAVTIDFDFSSTTSEKAAYLPSDFVIFSTSTIRQFIPDAMFNAIYVFMQGTCWVSMLMAMWSRRTAIFV